MERRDFDMSRVKKKLMKRHSSDLDLTLWMRFRRFNLSRYNSFDERLRLNHFYKNSSMSRNEPHSPAFK